MLAEGKQLPPWREITIRCHDFRVDFCTRCRDAGESASIREGHADIMMILRVYAKTTQARKEKDFSSLHAYMNEDFKALMSSTLSSNMSSPV